ncbi:MAG TPA: PAP2 family protein, partial [Micromonosporaceae bacterium]|nr:PAP2 family protein [Micromonosporaceae bacterium]
MDTHVTRQRMRPFEHFTGRTLVGLAAVVAAGTGFALLYVLVRLRWDPLYDGDHGATAWLNARVAPNEAAVAVLQKVTDLGGRPIMLWLVGVVAAGLLIRRRWRLGAYLIVTGVGALLLDPSLKLLVGRL